MNPLPFIAIFLFIASVISKRRFMGTIAWIILSAYFAFMLAESAITGETFTASLYVILIICSILFVLHRTEDITSTMEKVAIFAGVVYIPFAEISVFRDLIISHTTWITCATLNSFGVPAFQSPPLIYLNSSTIMIIPACTAIQAISIFFGIILATGSPPIRKISAILASVPVIYTLNIFRNAFVVAATGYGWFGSPDHSFYIAHHVIGRIGEIISLILIAYAVFTILPEVLDMIEKLLHMARRDILAVFQRS